jgi:FlaG/FlaF family flagellin (archaellin)
MKRIVTSVMSAMLMLGLMVSAAFAATSGAHFFSATSAINPNGSLSVTFDEAGLGQTTVRYSLAYSYSATFACINGGGNHPKAANKETKTGTSTVAASFTPKNGRVKATITTAAPSPGTFACPAGQTLVLANVSYSNIRLSDLTNSVSTAVASVSRMFVDIR